MRKLKKKDLKEMHDYIFDDRCECYDDINKYVYCCGGDCPFTALMTYTWDRLVYPKRFKNLDEKTQKIIMEAYNEQLTLHERKPKKLINI